MRTLTSDIFGDAFVDAIADQLEDRRSGRNGSSARLSRLRHELDDDADTEAPPAWEPLLDDNVKDDRGIRDLLIFELAGLLPAVSTEKLRTMRLAAEHYANSEPPDDTAGPPGLHVGIGPADAAGRKKTRRNPNRNGKGA